ncbi:MAG: CYTH and CHAD domain-containing protein [Thiobacillaceae bacterium]|nr:CYTH and CHAD domain-containing protein [Thiobacillaceae bacterium]
MTDTLPPLEIELKLALPVEQVAAFRSLMARRRRTPVKQILHTLYFDTPDFDLGRQGIALRVRRAGRRWLQTLKTEGQRAGGLSTREEYETPTQHGTLDWTRFPEAAQARIADDLRKNLAIRFETHFNRTAWQITGPGGARIEVALDIGKLSAGDHSQPICEIELELLSGRADALFALAQTWAQQLDLVPFDVSKAERGVRLAHGETPGPVKSVPLVLDRSMTVEEGFVATCQACLAQFQANLPEILFAGSGGSGTERREASSGTSPGSASPPPQPSPAGGEAANAGPKSINDIEYVHQARVALRRLRAALRVYRNACALPPPLLDGLRMLAASLGAARDWDVLCGETLPAIAPHYDDPSGWQDWMARLEAHRASVRENMRQTLAGAHPGAWLLAFQQWLLQHGWRAAAPETRLLQMAPQLDVARRILKKGHRGIVERAREFERLSPPERHALRIAMKRQRYAAEFFQGLFKARLQSRYLGLARDIQDGLGRANDAHVALTLLEELDFDSSRAGGFARGWLAAKIDSGADSESPALVQEFIGLQPYW